jgi:hypothetical protein
VDELRAAAVLDDVARTRCRRPRPSPDPPPPRPRHTTGTWSPSAVSRRLEHARRWRQRQHLRRKERGGDSNRRSSGDLLFPCVMPATLLLKAKGAAKLLLPRPPLTSPLSAKKILSYTILVPNCFCILFPSCISSSVSSGTPVPRGDGRSTAAAEDFAGDDHPHAHYMYACPPHPVSSLSLPAVR